MATPRKPDLEAAARGVCVRLAAGGYRALWAGGCVRDRLMGRVPKDIDIATNATPEQVAGLFPRTKGVGKSFGVVLVLEGGHWFEVATFRRDLGYEDGRRPVAVEYAGERADALRRDFTINGLFLDPATHKVLDYVGGRDDLAARCVRAIGDPRDRFAEDYLRMMRAVRFASVLDFRLDAATADAIRVHAHRIRKIAHERVRDELLRILTASPKAGAGVLLLRDTGLLAEILPEVAAMEGVAQPPEFHPEGDVLAHTVAMLDLMRAPTAELALAVLLHDSGKPARAKPGPAAGGGTRIRFDGHDAAGAAIAERVLRRLKFPLRVIEHVTRCVAGHMRFMNVPAMRPSTLRRMIAAPTFETEIELHRLDCLSSGREPVALGVVEKAREVWEHEKSLPQPMVRGGDVMAMGVAAGPGVGRWVRAAYDRQLESPGITRANLLRWVEEKIKAEG
jgi:poly(A) polymerase